MEENLALPSYEFKCPKCGHEFEKLCKLDELNPVCPNGCEVFTVKLMSMSSFVLQGGGWAADSYGGNSVKK